MFDPEERIWLVADEDGHLLNRLPVKEMTALAHRYWEYPAAQVGAQYNNFLKNIAIMGGTLLLFVTGPGPYSIDRMLAKK